ncbi:hypothetical protein XENOCAPTIV_015822, partial [Xenoophorus captivus]
MAPFIWLFANQEIGSLISRIRRKSSNGPLTTCMAAAEFQVYKNAFLWIVIEGCKRSQVYVDHLLNSDLFCSFVNITLKKPLQANKRLVKFRMHLLRAARVFAFVCVFTPPDQYTANKQGEGAEE